MFLGDSESQQLNEKKNQKLLDTPREGEVVYFSIENWSLVTMNNEYKLEFVFSFLNSKT